MCHTCNKVLSRNEQVHTKQTTTQQGPIVFGEINHTIIGVPLNRTTSEYVVRCRDCGSDAYAIPTDEEIRQQKARDKEERDGNIAVIVMLIVVAVVLALFAYHSMHGNN
jgi:hypothetical protein